MEMNSDKCIIKINTNTLIGPLNDIERKFAPTFLFYVGNKDLVLNSKRVSIIGTRNPSEIGIGNARRLTEFLVKKDVVIVSGLAKGVDTIAHKTAIEKGGKTIAVLGTPLNQYYPVENKNLQNKIMQNFLAISQFEVGRVVTKSNFPIRNRTMALLSQVSIIIEAGEKSGTIHQGWEALRLGRQLFILEEVAKDENLEWPNKLIEYGAEILSMKNLNRILDFFPTKTQEEILCVAF